MGILNLIEGTGSKATPANKHKRCAYNVDQQGHTIDECQELRTIISRMISSGKISHMWALLSLLGTKLKAGTPIIKDVLIHRYKFTVFVESYLDICKKLVRGKILTPMERKKRQISSSWRKDDDAGLYHGTTGHIEECSVFRVDLEHLINTGKIKIKFSSYYP